MIFRQSPFASFALSAGHDEGSVQRDHRNDRSAAKRHKDCGPGGHRPEARRARGRIDRFSGRGRVPGRRSAGLVAGWVPAGGRAVPLPAPRWRECCSARQANPIGEHPWHVPARVLLAPVLSKANTRAKLAPTTALCEHKRATAFKTDFVIFAQHFVLFSRSPGINEMRTL